MFGTLAEEKTALLPRPNLDRRVDGLAAGNRESFTWDLRIRWTGVSGMCAAVSVCGRVGVGGFREDFGP
jgi:hypothetical protein